MSPLRSFTTAAVLLAVAGCPDPVTPVEEGSGDGSSSDTTTMSGPGVDSTGDSGVDSTGGSGAGTTGVEPAECGNGVIEAGEGCDDAGESASCDADCTEVECGDSVINAAAGEVCEADDLGGATCESLGFEVGTVSCAADCASHDTGACYLVPGEPVLQLSFSQVKRFDFSWAAVAEAEVYQLLESSAPGEPFVMLGGDIVGESTTVEVPLHHRYEASYMLRACNGGACTDSAVVDVMGSLAEAVGYVKASNTDAVDHFGQSVALSADGNTLAVGARAEGSSATGIDGDQADDSTSNSGAGAVYVFTHDGMGTWSQQAYVKASNTGASDQFGASAALSADGNTLAVGAATEWSNATGINGDQADDSAGQAGAAYVFTRDGMGTWSQQAYVKASNTGAVDYFGRSAALSADGNILAVGAMTEDSNAPGIDGDQTDDSAGQAGAAYVFTRDGMGTWSQQAYVKASNPGAMDHFGRSAALSADGNILAVGADGEASSATGLGGDQADDSAGFAGAVYLY